MSARLVPDPLRDPVGLVVVAAAAGVGFLGGPRPGLALAGVSVAGLAVLARTFPVLLLAGLMLAAPLQPALEAIHPRLKVMDEGVMLLFSASVLVVALWHDPRGLLRRPLLWASAAFFGLGLLSAVVAGGPLGQAVLGLFVTLDYVVLAVALIALPVSRGTTQAVIVALLGLGAVAAMTGFLQHVVEAAALPAYGRFIWERDLLRVPSLFRHPNDLAYLMLPVTFVGAAGWWLRGGWAYALATVVGAVGMLLAVSRSSYLAVVLGVGCAVVFGGLASKRVYGLVLAGGLLLAPLMAPGVVSRIEKIQREGGDARWTYAQQGFQVMAEHPWLGIGPGRFGGVVAQRYGSKVHEQYGVEFTSTWKTVDSFWLHALVESGILGTAALLALLGVAFVQARRRLRSGEGTPEQRMLCLAVLMLVPAHLVINLSSMALEANATAAVLWLIVGLALSPAPEASRVEAALEGAEADEEPEAEAHRGVV